MITHLIADTQMRLYCAAHDGAYNYEGNGEAFVKPPAGARLIACATVDRQNTSVGGSSTFWRFVWDPQEACK
jgi:hypothetical protein